MYSYERRPKTAAKIDAYAKWRGIVDRYEALESKEMEALLHEMAKYLKSEGLELDVKRSHLGKDWHGSDGFRLEGHLVVTEAKENTIQALKPDHIVQWVEQAVDIHGSARKIGEGPSLRQVDDKPVGVWVVDISQS